MEVFILFAWLSDGQPYPATAYATSDECWQAVQRFSESLQAECRTATLATPIAPVTMPEPAAPTSEQRPRKNPNF